MPDEEKEHGPQVACYSNGPLGFRPFIQCLCGWHTATGAPPLNWEEAGVEFDEHLAEERR
jgi:hypothetical protein